MAMPKEPFSRKEEYLAKIANQAGAQKPAFPMSRTEEYLDYISIHAGEPEIVELHSATGALSDEEYEKVMKNNCIIIANSTQYFYKQYSAATVIRYGALPRITAQHGVIFDYIDIDRDTKSYEVKYEEFNPGE